MFRILTPHLFLLKMYPPMKLSRTEFLTLCQALEAKFYRQCDEKEPPVTPPKNKSDLYGWNADYEGFNLPRAIGEDPAVVQFMEGQRAPLPTNLKSSLYEKRMAVEKGRINEVSLDNFYTGYFLAYLDCKNEGEFREKHLVQDTRIVAYKGFYFSYRLYTVWEFDLEIDYGKHPFPTREWGIHTTETADEQSYSGSAKLHSPYLYINLEHSSDDPLTQQKRYGEIHMIGYVGEKKPQEIPIIQCSMTWASKFGYPVSSEVMLYKLGERNQAIPIETIREIKKYLMIKHVMFRIPNRIITGLENLRIKGHTIYDLAELPSKYRVWTKYKNGIVQSCLTINDDFQATFETSTYGTYANRQSLLLDVTSVYDRKKVCMSHHPDKGADLIAYVIMDIPVKNAVLTRGVFCSIGRAGAENPHFGWIFLKRENPKVDFVVKVFDGNEWKQMVDDTPDLKDFHDMFHRFSDRDMPFEHE